MVILSCKAFQSAEIISCVLERARRTIGHFDYLAKESATVAGITLERV